MARLHLVELEDLAWFPSVLRAALTEYMRLVARLGRQERSVAPIPERALDSSGATEIVDLRGVVESLEASDSYDWRFGTLVLPPSPIPGSYLIGSPRSLKS